MSNARGDYPYRLQIPTRWMDNDLYGHVNNVQYYSFVDTVVNRFLVEEGGLDIHHDPVIGLAVESGCRFSRSFAFPQTIQAGLRVAHLGTSSVRYEVGLFIDGDSPDRGSADGDFSERDFSDGDEPAAEAFFVHVFVDRERRRPAPVPAPLRSALERLMIG
jgi:acyl-CoA thioester hydrolase